VVVAPTGVAALQVGGMTIHSLFQLPPRLVLPGDWKSARPQLLRNIDTLLIDEISMVRADIFEGIDQVLRATRKDARPFGGVRRVICFGDPFQLPPVVSGAEERAYLDAQYGGELAITTPLIQQAVRDGRTTVLQEVFRQSDAYFIDLLNRVRHGDLTSEDQELLNERVVEDYQLERGEVVVTARVATAEAINERHLAALGGEVQYFTATLSGELSQRVAPADPVLSLKVGAQVMFVKNDQDKRWVNGTLGEITGIDGTTVIVKVGEREHEVIPVSWEQIRYDYDEASAGVVPKTTGSFAQLPLKLAWAVTVHKSQGQTFERVVLDLSRSMFAPGQLYVALSRCKSLEGLRLTHGVERHMVQVDPRVVEFWDRLGA